MAFFKRASVFSPMLEHLRTFVASDRGTSIGKSPVCKRFSRDWGNHRSIKPAANINAPLFSLRQASGELERLCALRKGCFIPADIQFVMATHTSLEEVLKDELAKASCVQAVGGYRELDSLPMGQFLKVLLKIYCDALRHSTDEFHGAAEDHVRWSFAAKMTEAARMLAMYCWVRSEVPVPIVWESFTAAYEFVRAHANQAVDTETSLIADSACTVVSLEVSRVLLMLLADPFSMNPEDLVAADTLIESQLGSACLDAFWSSGAVAFDLGRGAALHGWKADVSSQKCLVWLSVSHVVSSLLGEVTKFEVGASSNVPKEMLDLPRKLACRWMAFPSRRLSVRTNSYMCGHFVCGASSLIRLEKPGFRATDPHVSKNLGRACILLDQSDEGWRIRLRGANYLNLVPDILVGVDMPSAKRRSAGVISWVKRTSELYAEIGIRRLANEVEAVPLMLINGRWEGGSVVEFGLIVVNENGCLDKNEIELILPRDRLPSAPIESLKAVNTGCEFHVLDVLEEGRDFRRLRASSLASEARAKVVFASFSL